MMNKKENRRSARQAAQKAVLRDQQNRRIQDAATAPVNILLSELHAPLGGLLRRPLPPAGPDTAATR